jgi:hypothetical protein
MATSKSFKPVPAPKPVEVSRAKSTSEPAKPSPSGGNGAAAYAAIAAKQQTVATAPRSTFDGAATRFVDLLGPKTTLLTKIIDRSWIVDAVSAAVGNDAHPQHKADLDAQLIEIGVKIGIEAMGFASRIADCHDLEAVKALERSFDTWKAQRAATFARELSAAIDTYRRIERAWLVVFDETDPIVKDPANPNQRGRAVALTFEPGVPRSWISVETRVKCAFGRTALAQADNDGDGAPDVADWAPQEKDHFTMQFQRQLQDVWSTGAREVAPFRVSAPSDHLLAHETPKWSDVTARMQARVTVDASKPHFEIDVLKTAPGEAPRSSVDAGNKATFHIEDADRGYYRSGRRVGQRNRKEQPTLAHEWHHMIGNPDEYAENSVADSDEDRAACVAHFSNLLDAPDMTPERAVRTWKDQAAVNSDVPSPRVPVARLGIYTLANRSDIPDECFATRGAIRLRPGGQSQRGGTNISAGASDAARLSDRGSEVRAYMREGLVQELGSMLLGKFTPEVSFDHNLAQLPVAAVVETVKARIQNVLHDVALDHASIPSSAPSEPKAGEVAQPRKPQDG